MTQVVCHLERKSRNSAKPISMMKFQVASATKTFTEIENYTSSLWNERPHRSPTPKDGEETFCIIFIVREKNTAEKHICFSCISKLEAIAIYGYFLQKVPGFLDPTLKIAVNY